MSKRWTEEHDRFVHAYFDAVGAGIGPHDLGRSEAALIARAALLRQTGAWDALDRAERAREDYRRCLGMPATFEKTMERLG